MQNPSLLLSWLNFFIADVNDGLGPYLGVFLKEHDFSEANIGLVVTLSALVALFFGVFAGVLIDKTRRIKSLIAACVMLITVSTLANYFYPNFSFTLLAQISVSLCAVCLAPAFLALTLGLVGQRGAKRQISLNEAYKHAGTAFSAALAMAGAFAFGIGGVFVVGAVFGVFALLFLSFLAKFPLDYTAACGAESSGAESGANSNLATKKPKNQSVFFVLKDTRVLILGGVMFCFHLSNAYMLPLLSQRAHALGIDTSGAYAAATILVAQITMIFACMVCMRFLAFGDRSGVKEMNRIYFWLMAFCFVGLVVRGAVAASSAGLVAMVIVQVLDGVCAGTSGLVLPVLVANLLKGSGQINTAFAAVMTCGGVGGALSGVVGGFVAGRFGYGHAYVMLGVVALVGLVLWAVSFWRLVRV